MKVGLFIPCYIDQFYPQVGIATLEILERLGLKVEYPLHQTCCGQPMANSGSMKDAEKSAKRTIAMFKKFEYVVCPSGSCVCFIRNHYDHFKKMDGAKAVQQNMYELCEFLTDIVPVKEFNTSFPFKVGIHNSCHGLRGLRLGNSSEMAGPPSSKIRNLLSKIQDIEIVDLERPDECCGFGGTFSIYEEAISCKMGMDRIKDHEKAGAEVITGADMSCLMHMEGLIRRDRKSIRVCHISEMLAGTIS